MTLVTVGVVVLVAAMLQGALGFGFGLVTMAILPRLLGIDVAVPWVACHAQLVNLVLLAQLRGSLRWNNLRYVILGGVVGTPPGVWLLAAAPPRALTVTLGVVMLGWFALTRLRRAGTEVGPPPLLPWDAWGALAGAAGGFLGGAFNTGGPPLVLYAGSRRDWSPDEARAFLQAFFAATAMVQLPLLIRSGMLDAEVATLAAWTAPMVLVGLIIGVRAGKDLDRTRYQEALSWAVAALGLSYLW